MNQTNPGQQLINSVADLINSRLQKLAEASISWEFNDALKEVNYLEKVNSANPVIPINIFGTMCSNATTRIGLRRIYLNQTTDCAEAFVRKLFA